MRILVSGANGQLGSELKEFQPNTPDWEFIFTDIDELNLTDFNSVERFISESQPDLIVNCAAYTAVDKAEEDYDKALLLNATVPGKLADFSKKYNCKFIHVSTDYVFSGKGYRPLIETDETVPESAYGKTKLEGEKKVLKNDDAVIIRTSWLYSQFGHNFVKSMLRLGTEREQLGVVFDQVGSPTNAADLAYAIVEIASQFDKNKKWVPGIYHFSNEGVSSWYDFAKNIMDFAKLPCKVNAIETKDYPLPAPRPFYSVMNKTKIKTTFGIEIPFWQDSLKQVLSILTNNN